MTKTLFIIFMATIFSCKAQHDVYVEKIAEENLLDENRYNKDNLIYKVGRTFSYSFEFFQKERKSPSKITEIKFEIQSGLSPFIRIDPEYNQTVFKLFYSDNADSLLFRERTGLIENNRNLWLHPPRSGDLEVLQMNAFPYYKSDMNVEQWKWHLEASYQEHKNIQLLHEYTRGETEYVNYKGQSISCIVIYSKTTSSLANSKAKFLYNKKFGFMKMEFQNFDGSSHVLSLTNTNFE